MPRQVNCVFLALSFSLFDHIQWLASSIVVYTTQDAWKLLDNVVRWRVYVGWVVSSYELAPTLAHQQWTTGSWQAQVNCPAVLCRRHLSTLSSTWTLCEPPVMKLLIHDKATLRRPHESWSLAMRMSWHQQLQMSVTGWETQHYNDLPPTVSQQWLQR